MNYFILTSTSILRQSRSRTEFAEFMLVFFVFVFATMRNVQTLIRVPGNSYINISHVCPIIQRDTALGDKYTDRDQRESRIVE